MTTLNLFEQIALEQANKDNQNLMMLPSLFWPNHHDSFKHKYLDSKFKILNQRYFGSDDYKLHILKTPLLKLEGHANFSKAEKWEILKKEPLSILQFKLDECSKTMIDYALEQRPELLSIIDSSVQTEERIRQALKANGLVLGVTKEEFKTYKNCKMAVAQSIYAIKFVPHDLVDEHFIDAVINSNEWVLDLLPRSVAIQDKVQDHFYDINNVRAFDDYIEIFAIEGLSRNITAYLNSVIKNNLKGIVFKNLSSAFYISECFNRTLIEYMQANGPEIIFYFDIDQLHEIHIQHAIDLGVVFDKLPISVWKYIVQNLIQNKTEQLFHFPESLKGLISGSLNDVLNYCLESQKVKPELVIPNFLFGEVAYKDNIDENVIRFNKVRLICDMLVNGKVDDMDALLSINGTNATTYEIKLLADKVQNTKIGRLFESNPIWYPLLMAKNVENSVRFVQAFPTAYYEIDEEMLKNEDFINEVNKTNPEFFDF